LLSATALESGPRRTRLAICMSVEAVVRVGSGRFSVLGGGEARGRDASSACAASAKPELLRSRATQAPSQTAFSDILTQQYALLFACGRPNHPVQEPRSRFTDCWSPCCLPGLLLVPAASPAIMGAPSTPLVSMVARHILNPWRGGGLDASQIALRGGEVIGVELKMDKCLGMVGTLTNTTSWCVWRSTQGVSHTTRHAI
jgi:hypothetical protein